MTMAKVIIFKHNCVQDLEKNLLNIEKNSISV